MDPPHKRPFLPGLNYSRKCSSFPDRRFRTSCQLKKQHNHVKPAISEYKGNCEGLVDSQPGQSKATQIACLFSTPSYLREATWSQCTKAKTLLFSVEGVHRHSLADWLTAWAPEQWCHTSITHAIWSQSLRSCARPYRLGISTNQRADGSISESLLSRNSTSDCIGGELMSILSK